MKADPEEDSQREERQEGRAKRRAPNALPLSLDLDGAGRRGTAAATIHRQLRHEILTLVRKPGEPILEKEIAEAFGVSRTPVREALLRLADERLTEIAPQSGTFVARIPIAALPEAIIVRKALEGVTVRAAAERASRSQIAGLRAILERQREMLEGGDRERFHLADEAFHAAIAEAAAYPGVWTLIQQAKIQLDRYRRLTLPEPGRIGRIIIEHSAVVDAIELGDGDRAAIAMVGHLDGLSASLETVRISNPGYFVGPVPR